MDVDEDNERHRREEQERRAKRKVRIIYVHIVSVHHCRLCLLFQSLTNISTCCTHTLSLSLHLQNKTGGTRIQIGFPDGKRAKASRARSANPRLSKDDLQAPEAQGRQTQKGRGGIVRLPIAVRSTRRGIHHRFEIQECSPQAACGTVFRGVGVGGGVDG